MTPPTERVFWLVLKSAAKHKMLLVASFVANTFAAMFEGVSLGMLALAISVITGDYSSALLVKLGSILESVFHFSLDQVNKDILFFIFIGAGIFSQLIKAAFHYGGVASSIYLRTYAIGDIQGKVVKQIMSFSLGQVNRYPGGELFTYVGMAAATTTFLLIINSVLSRLLLLIGYLVVMTTISPLLTIIGVGVGGLMVPFLSKVLIKLRHYGKLVTKAGIRVGKEAMEFLQAHKFLRIYGKEEYAGNLIIAQIEKGLHARRSGELLRALIHPSFESIAMIFAGALLIVGYYLLTDKVSAPLSTLLAFIVVFRRLMSAISEINNDRARIANIMPSAEKVAEIMRNDNKDFTRQTGVEISQFNSEIHLKDVCFSYEGADKSILTNISLTIPSGSVIGIVGESGSGKTTLIDIILGLYPPDSGIITMDNISLEDSLPRSWRRQFGVVSQDSFVFNSTIKENLSVVNPAATEEEIIEAAKVAYAHDFILEQAEGYDTKIGDRGHRLSGGQVQRLALARAILSKASILVLDEATSALDTLSEQKIIEAVEGLGDKHTIFQVAHRLSTIFKADSIIVMKDGSIIERGTHGELLKINGEYARMWAAQSTLSY